MLGVVTVADVASATLVAEGLRTLARPPRCFLGGALARTVEGDRDGVAWLPDPLDEAIARLTEVAGMPTPEWSIADRRGSSDVHIVT